MTSPDSAGVGRVRQSSPEPWTGEKRLKSAHGRPTLSQIQEEGFVFSEEDEYSVEDVLPCVEELQSRNHLLSGLLGCTREGSSEYHSTLMKRLAKLRLVDYKVLKQCGAIPDDTPEPSPYYPFEDPDEPAPNLYGWTIYTEYICYRGFTDYQRIVPMRAHREEYLLTEWDTYCTTFSNYHTDIHYVKYCDELSKKIKWIEKYLAPDYYKAIRGTHYRIGYRQALKIAAGFSHLPAELAIRGYKEYTNNLQYELELKDYVRAAFEIWKRVIMQKMCYEDALNQTLAVHTFNYPSIVKKLLNGWAPHFLCLTSFLYEIQAVKDDEALKLISDLVHQRAQRAKFYLDFVKLKLEVAQRTGLMSMCPLIQA